MFFINRAWTTPKSFLSIDGKIETKKNYPAEVVFLKIKSFGSGDEVTMLIDAHTLRAVGYGAQELLVQGRSDFRNFTEKNGVRKQLSWGAQGNRYYLNLTQTDAKGATELAHLFGPYALRAFTKTVSLFCDTLEQGVYTAQCAGAFHGSR